MRRCFPGPGDSSGCCFLECDQSVSVNNILCCRCIPSTGYMHVWTHQIGGAAGGREYFRHSRRQRQGYDGQLIFTCENAFDLLCQFCVEAQDGETPAQSIGEKPAIQFGLGHYRSGTGTSCKCRVVGKHSGTSVVGKGCHLPGVGEFPGEGMGQRKRQGGIAQQSPAMRAPCLRAALLQRFRHLRADSRFARCRRAACGSEQSRPDGIPDRRGRA